MEIEKTFQEREKQLKKESVPAIRSDSNSSFQVNQPQGQYQQQPQQYGQQGMQQQGTPQQSQGQYQQSSQQQPGTMQQQPQQYGQQGTQQQGTPQQYQGQFQQSPQQQPQQYRQQGMQQQGTPQQSQGQLQQPCPPAKPCPPASRLPRVVSAKINIEGVKIVLKELINSDIEKEWILRAYLGISPRLYISGLKWSITPDDGTFSLDESTPEMLVVRLKNKDNIWADPKLKMVTKEYTFFAQADGKSGGKISSIDSILFSNCYTPIEFYTADKQPFIYPSGYKYLFYLQQSDGKYVNYKMYEGLGTLDIDLKKGFKERVVFHWNENTAGKSTSIRLEIIDKGKIVIKKNQKMTSICRNVVGDEVPPPSLSTSDKAPIPPPSTSNLDHPNFRWDGIQFTEPESDGDFFRLSLDKFRIVNNKPSNILNARNYFVEARFFHKGFEEGKTLSKDSKKKQLSIVTKILPPHVDNQRIYLRGKMDDFARMGYILEDNPDKWYEGYVRFYFIFDSNTSEEIQTSSLYPCRYKYKEGIFSKGYEFELGER